jgi:hypothetical protein
MDESWFALGPRKIIYRDYYPTKDAFGSAMTDISVRPVLLFFINISGRHMAIVHGSWRGSSRQAN